MGRLSFTVVIPTHERREHLLLALESALAQTRPAEQVIVVADGCTDGSAQAVEARGHERVEVLDLPKGLRKGWPHRNEALRRARGDAIAYLADDDLWLPDHLERVGEALDAGAADVVQAMAVTVFPDGRLERRGLDWRVPAARERFLAGEEHWTPMSAVAHRAGVAEAAGGWPEDPPGQGDADLWRRILRGRPRTTMLLDPTVLFLQAWVGEPAERLAQARALAARVREPRALAQLRGEIALAFNAPLDVRRHDDPLTPAHLAALHEQVAALEQQVTGLRAHVQGAERLLARAREDVAGLQAVEAALRADAAVLLESDATLRRIVAGRWYRLGRALRRALAPALRLSRRAGTSRTG